MKFTEYIEETSKYHLKLYGVVQSLFKNSMPFIKELRKSGNELIWRGTSKSRTKSIIQVTPRQDRFPKDMPEFLHDSLDNEFEKKFGWRPRSTGVFTTSRRADARSYGDAYMFFPAGKYRYVYSPHIQDLFGEVDDSTISGYSTLDEYLSDKEGEWEDDYEIKYGEGEQGEWAYLGETLGTENKDEAFELAAEIEGWDDPDEIAETDLTWEPDLDWEDYKSEERDNEESHFDSFIDEAVKGYRDNNLGMAIKKKVEIMFDCNSFYLVNASFQKDIEKYVLKGESMEFDPKQKQLGFERIPKKSGKSFRNREQLKHPEFEGADWELHDAPGSRHGQKSGKNYMKLLSKSHKGKQQKFK